MIKEKNIFVALILSFLTCGIYYIYWLVCINDDIDSITSNPSPRNGALVIILTIVTCGLYGLYWWYLNGKLMEEHSNKAGVQTTSSGIIFLILTFLGVAFINAVIVQNDINKYANHS